MIFSATREEDRTPAKNHDLTWFKHVLTYFDAVNFGVIYGVSLFLVTG
jgi:hypothetical protein